MIAFLDIEASGIHPDSWPVEIGWALPFGGELNGDVLIRPMPEWTHWSMLAERHFHKISRATLERDGLPPGEALSRIEGALYGCEVYVEDVEEDRVWFNRLVAATGRETTLRLQDARAMFEAQALRRRHSLADIRRHVAARFPHRHRAQADARQMAEIWRNLVR
jgi:hypothetical protein